MENTNVLEYINKIRASGLLDSGQPSFLREWEPVRFLGKGSYGVVYEIKRGRERCAVKIIDMSRPNIDYSVEISALNMLRGHKHAATIYEYAYVNINHGGFTDRFLLIRMNLLSDLPGTMNEDEVIDLAEQMCEILSVCHSGEDKIYHCDIKPENILQAGDGSYILCDFGASNITQKSHKSSGHAGTPLYESPEMLRFRSFDGRSDLFSLGITMYVLLNNGLPPFAKNNNDADAVRMRLESKKAIPAINGVSADLMKIMRKACAFDADRRYRSAGEMRKALLALRREREAARIARLRAEEDARRREEETRRKAEQERLKHQNAADKAENSPFAMTGAPGENKTLVPAQKTNRKPLGIIAIAAALVAAIVCGVIWLPGIGVRKNSTEHLTFEKTDGGYKVIYFDNKIEDVVIPSKYNGEPVIQIGDSAFIGRQKMKSVYIPDSVTSIGDYAFSECEQLTSVTIPDGVTSVGDYAFSSCEQLTSVTITDGVTSIGDMAFSRCYNLYPLTIPDSVTSIGKGAFSWCGYINVSSGNKYYKSDNKALMSKDGTVFLHCSTNFSGDYIIPDGVTSIDEYAFTTCDRLTSITMPESVTSIGECAIYFCDGLTSITIPKSVTSIGDGAFFGCWNLTVTAPHEPSYYGYVLVDGVNWNVK